MSELGASSYFFVIDFSQNTPTLDTWAANYQMKVIKFCIFKEISLFLTFFLMKFPIFSNVFASSLSR